MTPPVVFVEWIASAPVEIELIAQLPPTDKPAESVQYYNPPDVRPLPTFSRVALVRSERQIYISGLFARAAGRGEEQARDLFAQLQDHPRPDGQRHAASGQGLVLRVRRRRGQGLRQGASPVLRPAASPRGVEGHGAWRRAIGPHADDGHDRRGQWRVMPRQGHMAQRQVTDLWERYRMAPDDVTQRLPEYAGSRCGRTWAAAAATAARCRWRRSCGSTTRTVRQLAPSAAPPSARWRSASAR